MAKQILNHVNVDTLLQKMGRKAVPQRVNSDGLVETCGLSGGAADTLQLTRCNPPSWVSREQPVLRTFAPPIIAQDAEQLLGQHHVAILAPLGLPNDNDHPCTVDIAGGQLHGLGDA